MRLKCGKATLKLGDDVDAALKRLRLERGATFSRLVNDALRLGLAEMSALADGVRGGPTRSVTLGRLRVASLDNISETLAAAERESFK